MQPSRRQVLTGAAVALSAACTSHRSAPPPAPDPDVALTAAAVAREQALLALYDEALQAVPALRAELAPYRADHIAHLAALRPSPSPSASGPSPTTAPPATRTTPRQLRARVAAAERGAATAHTTACLAASPRLAAVLASLAACEASHASLL